MLEPIEAINDAKTVRSPGYKDTGASTPTMPDTGMMFAGGGGGLVTTQARGKSGKSRPRCGAAAEERYRLLSGRRGDVYAWTCALLRMASDRPCHGPSEAFRSSVRCALHVSAFWAVAARGLARAEYIHMSIPAC